MKTNELKLIKKCALSLNAQKQLVPLNPNLKIYKKCVLERLKMFKILFLYLVPVNTQNETCTKITSESAVLKQISKSIPFLIQKKKKKMNK